MVGGLAIRICTALAPASYSTTIDQRDPFHAIDESTTLALRPGEPIWLLYDVQPSGIDSFRLELPPHESERPSGSVEFWSSSAIRLYWGL